MFLQKAEQDPICRKLQLKDFIPTEVQRLTKYTLLFRELYKAAPNEQLKSKLEQCMNASSRISTYVNTAVTECENTKRIREIQSRLDTTALDTFIEKYARKELSPYKVTFKCKKFKFKILNYLFILIVEFGYLK